MKKINIDWIRVAGLTGTVMGVAASLLSGWASDKTMHQAIKKEVAKAVAEQNQK